MRVLANIRLPMNRNIQPIRPCDATVEVTTADAAGVDAVFVAAVVA